MQLFKRFFSLFSRRSVDIAELTKYIQKRTNIDESEIAAVLIAEEDFLKEKGIAF